MGNCLKTKLKVSVNNDNLNVLGEFKFSMSIKAGVQVPISIDASEPFDIKIEGDGHFYKGTIDSQTDITTEIKNVITTSGYRVSPGTSTIRISNKYAIQKFIFNTASNEVFDSVHIDFNELMYNTPGISGISVNSSVPCNDISCDIDKINLNNVANFAINSINFKGNIVKFAEALGTSNSTIGVASVTTGLYGVIEDFVRNIAAQNYGNTVLLIANNYTFHNETVNYTISIVTDAQGNAILTNVGTSSQIASYTKTTDIFEYN